MKRRLQIVGYVMSNVRNCSLLLALALNGFHIGGLAHQRPRFDEKEIIQTLKDNYRIYLESNAKKSAQREIAEFVFHSSGAATDLLSNLQKVSLPICDLDRPAFEWRFVAPSDSERVLKYVGNLYLGMQFLRWTDSVWIRLGGSNERYREGMYCGRPFSKGPQLENYVVVDLNSNFVGSRKAAAENTQNAFLQLGSKFQTNGARKMEGTLNMSASASLRDVRVTLELWSTGPKGSVLVSKVDEAFLGEPMRAQTIRLEGQIEARQEAFLVAKLESTVVEGVGRGEITGRIFIFDAKLQPSE